MKTLSGIIGILLTLILSNNVIKPTQSARILSFTAVSTKSHKIIYEPLLFALGERGHNVTIYGTLQVHPDSANVKNVQTYDPAEVAKKLGDIYKDSESSSFFPEFLNNPFIKYMPFIDLACRATYENPAIVDLLHRIESGDPHGKFDLVILPPLSNECLYGLVDKLNTTMILVSQLPLLPWLAESTGTPWLPSINPLIYHALPEEMNFVQRIHNFVGVLWYEAVMHFYYWPRVEDIYREYVGQDAQSVLQVQKNFSIVLVNSHMSFSPPQPIMPDIVEVGGMHLRPAKPVSKELDDYLTGSGEDGFIVFSMGSHLRSVDMPEKHRNIFINTFRRLKQRVLWKWEGDAFPDCPPNVKLTSWVPQQDVLGHKNIRLFITHGGHGTIAEALYEGVPLVGIPMFADQESNMKQAVNLGFAISLGFEHLTEEALYEALQEIVQQPEKYKKKAKELSTIFHDQINKPLDRAVFWTEYVLRHGGAPHLRSASRRLNFFQYFSLDVITALIIILLTIIFTSVLVVKLICRKIFGQTINLESKQKKKQ